MLRTEHPLFHSPRPIDFGLTTEIPLPPAWTGKLPDPTIRVLPLVAASAKRLDDGWCTYTYEHEQVPELETICGGINAKTPLASGIWRQGFVTHFGFEQSPTEMNDTGRALLVNTIAYAARFAEDRPNIRRSEERILDRGAIERLIRNEKLDLEGYFDWFFGGALRAALRGKSRSELAAWYRANRGYLTADAEGKFIVDQAAQRFGIPPDSAAFLPAAIDRLAEDGVRDLLWRYAPCGPGRDASAQNWQAWHREHQPYLFFSDSGGFRWYVDQLALKRRVATADLRGGDRGREVLP